MSNKRGRGVLLNRTEMASHLGIAMPTLDDWVRRGCPVVRRGGKGQPWQFNSAEVRAWRDEDIRRAANPATEASPDELKRRRAVAETELLELELARERGKVVDLDQYERALAVAFAEVRATLRRVVPARAARRVVGEDDETRIKAVLLEEIDGALIALAEEQLIDESDLDLEPVEGEEDED